MIKSIIGIHSQKLILKQKKELMAFQTCLIKQSALLHNIVGNNTLNIYAVKQYENLIAYIERHLLHMYNTVLCTKKCLQVLCFNFD